MPTTQDIVTALLIVATDLITWPLLLGVAILITLTVGPKLRHAH